MLETASLLALLLPLGLVGEQGPELTQNELARPHAQLPLDAQLYELDRLARAGLSMEPLRREYGLLIDPQGLLEIAVVGTPGRDPIAASLVAAHGGWIRLSWRHRASVRVPPARLVELARNLPPGFRLEMLGDALPLDVEGEGPGAIGTDSYREAGADGAGIKVAIFDNGFQYYAEAKANGDLPPYVDSTILDGGANLSAGGTHGTACAEQIADHAPGAALYLVKMSSNDATQLGEAVQWCIQRDIDIITISLSYFNEGWEDGSGDSCAAIEQATDAGILVFAAAGNFALQHWRGSFEDDDSDGWHNWSPSDETNHVDLNDGDQLKVYLQWDNTGASSGADYDLYLYDESITVQLDKSTTGPDAPYERLSYTNTSGASERVKVLIRKVAGPSTDLQLFQRAPGASTAIERYTTDGSVTSLAASTAPNLIAVGAVDEDDFYAAQASGLVMVTDWSSRGPTNSGNLKPELVGPTRIQCFSKGYPGSPSGQFSGTSCATPNVAGSAAALWSSLPAYSATGIRMLLLRQALLMRDWGSAGVDDVYGHGGASLYPFHIDTAWVDGGVSNTFGLPNVPFQLVAHAYTAVGDGGRILFLGGDYSALASMNKDVRIDTVRHDAVIGK